MLKRIFAKAKIFFSDECKSMVAACRCAASANSQLLPARQVRVSKFAQDGTCWTPLGEVFSAKLDLIKRTKER